MFDLQGNLQKLAENLKKEHQDDVYIVSIDIIKKVTNVLLTKKQVYIKNNKCKLKIFGPQKVKILLLKNKIEEVFLTNELTQNLTLEL